MVLTHITHLDLNAAVARLVSNIAPSAIICFGHSGVIENHESCFNKANIERHHFDLLVVQANGAHYKSHEIVDFVKGQFPDGLSVNVLSHSEKSVSEALRDRHPFFCKIFNEGFILHVAQHFQFERSLGDSKNSEPSKSKRESERSFTLSQSLLEVASDALSSGSHDVGVFLLHQSVEQMCIASIKAHLSYRPTTHNVANLIDLVGCYLPEVKDLFPCNTSDEQELFDFLRKAYSDVRYKASYRIPEHIAFSLLERVTEFQHLILNRYKKEYDFEIDEGL